MQNYYLYTNHQWHSSKYKKGAILNVGDYNNRIKFYREKPEHDMDECT